jgi:hypothetical protein
MQVADIYIKTDDGRITYRLTDFGTMAEETVGVSSVECESYGTSLMAGINEAKSLAYGAARITIRDQSRYYSLDISLTPDEIDETRAAWLLNELLFCGRTWPRS